MFLFTGMPLPSHSGDRSLCMGPFAGVIFGHCVSSPGAIRHDHRLGDCNILSSSSRSQKSEIMVSAGLVPSKGSGGKSVPYPPLLASGR